MDIKIIKYDDSFAAKVADMWNHSRDGWGGSNTIDTEETILHRERNSTNIHTYLALEGDKVVGYCGFSEYRDDEGALYIPLLNVRDDYHGKKIGKKLLLTALQETIDLKWPRLDLYTWPGNTKAVPLYKKCGFFWEDRDDTTHLMNFMPTVLHTEAVNDFFQKVNWYDSSTREIVVKPDGRVENDFHYYEYAWEKENAQLRIEFERTGRGIRLIETNDYVISAEVDQHQLVFGNHYTIRYRIENKSGEPLNVTLNGVNDKNIAFSFDKSIHVTDIEEVTGSFYVGPIDEEQNTFHTHPTVQTIVHINGKEAVFKLGILPKYPAQLEAQLLDEELSFIGQEKVFYLDVMNNFQETVQFEIDFPESLHLQLKSQQLSITLNSKERISIPVEFMVKSHGYYDAKLKIKAVKENEEEVTFYKQIGIALRGIGAQFHGEDQDRIDLYNGQYFASLIKDGNKIHVGRKKTDQSIMLMAPKIGKPYSEEIPKLKPVEKQFFEGPGYTGVKVSYKLSAFPSIQLHYIIKLYGEGLVESYYEVENATEKPTEQPLWFSQSIIFDLEKAQIPYQGKIVEMDDSIGNSYQYWDESKVSENWIFVKQDSHPIGMCWHEDDRIHFGTWFNYFEHDLGQLDGGSIARTNSLFFSIGAFHDMESFRSFAKQSFYNNRMKTAEHLTVSLENENPFVQGEKAVIQVTDFKSNYLHGELSLSISGSENAITTAQFNRENQQSNWLTEVELRSIPPVSTIKIQAELDAASFEKETLVIRQSSHEVKEEIVLEEGLDTWKIDNGIIQFKAAPDFFPTAHSLNYQGHEWLDSPFPTRGPKLWWNPWPGGITGGIAAIRPHSLSKEKTSAEFSSLIDSKGNQWKGIKLSTSIEKNEDYKGLVFHQYYLTLPGTPVLCHVSEVQQETGKLFNHKEWLTAGFFKPGVAMHDNWVNFQNQAGKWTKIVAGKDENDFRIERNSIIGCRDRKEQLHVISSAKSTIQEAYINKEILFIAGEEKLTIPAGKTKFTTPTFYLFTNETIPNNAQQDLKEITFGGGACHFPE
jgi:GNAT superfamily N-acetyltransferase